MPDNSLDARIRIIAKEEIAFEDIGGGDRGARLHEIGGLELPPCTVADREHPHRLPLFIDFIENPVDVRLLAVEQVPQLSFRPASFRRNGAAMGMRARAYTACSNPLYQRAAARDSAAFFSR
jgi:hypothetical protein